MLKVRTLSQMKTVLRPVRFEQIRLRLATWNYRNMEVMGYLTSYKISSRQLSASTFRRAWLACLLAFVNILSLLPASLGAQPAKSGEPRWELKKGVPRLDKRATVLKGGVQHSEHKTPPRPHKLSSGARKSTVKGDASKLQKRTAQTAVASPLKSNTNILNGGADQSDTVETGVGIIGVKFLLASGSPPVINRVFAGTPAFEQGLAVGDVIVAVDGIPTFGLTKEEVYNMIVGTPGTPVTVSVRRHGNFRARSMNRMDFNDIKDPVVRRDYMMSM